MPRQLERLLDLDQLLRSQPRPTATRLAELLERSERTIRKDLEILRDRYHAPLEYSRSKGHHYTDAEWRLPSISLSKGELFALTLGARMLSAYAGTVYLTQLRSAIDRLSERLPEQSWVELQQVAEERILFQAGAEIDLDPETWHRLETACSRRLSVQMTYYTASRNAVSERQFDPYLLYLYRGTNPYVIGFCRQRQAIRWFRVDRIQQLEVLAEPFVPDPTFDAKDYLEAIFQHEAGGELLPVTIWFDPPTAPYIRERRWHPTQELEEHLDGSLTLHMQVRGMNDLKRWVLGYGKGARAEKPPELVQLVRAEIAGMNKWYEED